MSQWPSTPDREEPPSPIDLLRVQPGKPLTAIVTCQKQVGAYTHYWRGRTVKCTGRDDEPCRSGRVARWYGYLSVWSPKTNRYALFEITPACVSALTAYLNTYGTLRGAVAKLERRNYKANSTVILSLQPGPYADDKIPAAPDIQAHLERMWEIRTQPSAETPAPSTLPLNRMARTNGRSPD